jgi:HTH-type transcriptional regulator, sugar sensing transcriptional regulator
MIVKEDLLNKLRHYFSLNLYEVRLWTALLSRGVSTAGELSDIANVPRSRSYDVLESLEKKGFVLQKFGKPIKYMAVPPEEVIDRVKKHMKKEADEKVNRLDDVRAGEVMTELNSLHKQGVELVDPTDLSGSLKGRHNLYNHIDMMIKSSDEQVTIVTSKEGFIRKVEGLKHSIKKASERGVVIRIAAPLDKDCMKVYKDIKDFAEVRSSEAKARFVIVDKEELIFMVMDDSEVHPTYDVGIWVNTPLFANAMEDMFELAWKDLAPADEVLK